MQAEGLKSSDATRPITSAQTSGGFRIDIGNDGLAVTAISPFRFSRPSRKTYLLLGLAFCVGLSLLQASGSVFVIGAAFVLVVLILRYTFVETHNLRCTRDNLEVIDLVRGRTRKTRVFLRTAVREIRFGPVSYGRYGAVCGLIFTVADEKVKVLSGLQCVEAQKILDELQRLGYDTVRDVGMPMMVEMEESRRKFWGIS